MIKDDGQTRRPSVTRTGAGAARRRPTTAGGVEARAGPPLATSSTLPLFPSASDGHPQDQLRPRAPLGVRRPAPAVPRVRLQAPRLLSEPRLSFENAQPVAACAGPAPRPAAPLWRLAAGLFDAVLLVSLDAVVILLTLRLAELDLQSLETLPVAPLAGFLILLNGGYVVVLTCAGGQTFGKMVFGMCVVDRAGRPVTISIALVRVLGYLVSVLPLGLGVVWMVLDTDRRALHDLLAGTRVLMVSGGVRTDSRLLGSGNRDVDSGKDGVADRRRPAGVPSPETRMATRDAP